MPIGFSSAATLEVSFLYLQDVGNNYTVGRAELQQDVDIITLNPNSDANASKWENNDTPAVISGSITFRVNYPQTPFPKPPFPFSVPSAGPATILAGIASDGQILIRLPSGKIIINPPRGPLSEFIQSVIIATRTAPGTFVNLTPFLRAATNAKASSSSETLNNSAATQVMLSMFGNVDKEKLSEKDKATLKQLAQAKFVAQPNQNAKAKL